MIQIYFLLLLLLQPWLFLVFRLMGPWGQQEHVLAVRPQAQPTLTGQGIGAPVPAQAEQGLGIYFYLPKMESAEEAAFWRDFFAETL